MKKKTRLPLIMLCITLVIAIVVSGLTYPGFLLGLFSPKDERETVSEEPTWAVTEEEKQAAKIGASFSEGNSSSFSIEPIEGIEISAPKNALDRDREFKMEEVTGQQFNEFEQVLNEEIVPDSMLLAAFELDAGLADDEMLPGNYSVDISLDKIGVEPEEYEYVQAFRIDDAGNWYEYCTSIEDGVLHYESNQNSCIALTIALAVAGGLFIKDTITGISGGAFFNPFTYTFPVKVEGVHRFDIMLDRAAIAKEMKQNQMIKDTNFEKDASTRAEKEVQEFYHIDVPKDRFILHERDRYNRLYNKYLKENIQKDPYYESYKQNIKQYQENVDALRDELIPINKVVENAQTAYVYLRDEIGCTMFNYILRIELSMSLDFATKGYGAAIPKHWGNPYFVLNMKKVSEGGEKIYQGCLLTMVHEIFHVIQRGYVSSLRANYKFDEMMAQCVEWDAYDYFKEEGKLTFDETTLLENLQPSEYFAIPLDGSTKVTYPDGKIAASDAATAAYPIAPFLRWLKKYCSTEYSTIMRRYKALWGSRSLTTILKACFLETDSTLTREWLQFAEEDQTRFYERGSTSGVDAEAAAFKPENMLVPDGKVHVLLANKNYTIRVRNLCLTRARGEDKNGNRNSNIAVLIKKTDNYDDLMSDFALIPLNMEKDKGWREWEKGIFIEPQKFNISAVQESLFYIMEADGGTGKSTEGWIWDTDVGYDAYTLTPLPDPEKKVEANILSIKPIKIRSDALAEVVDSIVFTIYLDKKVVTRERIMYEKWEEDWTLKLDDLRIDDKPLTEEQKSQLTYTWQECVTGTYETEKPCLGPTDDPKLLIDDVDIVGLWDMESESTGIDYGMFRGLIAMMPDEMKDYYNSIFDSYNTASGKFVMEVRKAPEGSDYGYDVKFTYEVAPDAPHRFKGYFNDKDMILRLSPAEGTVLMNEMEILIAKEQGRLTATGTTSFDSEIVSYNTTCSGIKTSGLKD